MAYTALVLTLANLAALIFLIDQLVDHRSGYARRLQKQIQREIDNNLAARELVRRRAAYQPPRRGA